MHIKNLLCLIIFPFVTSGVLSQDAAYDEIAPDIEWSDGSIMLNNGGEIKGLIRYNDKIGLVAYISYDDKDHRSFIARNILGFEFFDNTANRQRVFYTIEYAESKRAGKQPFLFELLMDFGNFVVLSKVNPVKIKQRQTQGVGFGTGNVSVTVGDGTVTKVNQTETVFIMNDAGEIEPYLEIRRKVVDGMLFDRKNVDGEIVDYKLLKKYLAEPGYSRMVQYANDQGLNFYIKEDLLQILEYYRDNIY